MYRWEKTRRDGRFLNGAENPSFSSTLLDKIYRSIDEGERKSGEMKFYRETTGKKQSRSNGKCNGMMEEEEVATESLRRACLLEKWMDRKVSEKVGNQGRQRTMKIDRKLRSHHRHDNDKDVLFLSSGSNSSDSSSGGCSSSDTESMNRLRSGASCLAQSWPKPVRTSVSVRSDKSEKILTERKQSTLFVEQKKRMQMFDNGFIHNSNTECNVNNDEALMKSKSRALKIYNNLKKVKQPISPGGKLTNFLNSLFTTTNPKKNRGMSSVLGYEEAKAERKSKSDQASTCSSASSFSRSCLSKTSPSSREKLRNGVKKTVHFYPVSVIVDEDSRPCGHKCLYGEEDTSAVPVSVPTAWKIGRPPTKKNEEDLKFPVMEKNKRVKEAAREFLKEYRHNQKKSDLILRDFSMRTIDDVVDEENDDGDDAASYSSSDLFELDHLPVLGNGRYCEDLPVYETTHVNTNRAIANGFRM